MVFSSPLFVYYYLPLALAVYCLTPRRAKHFALTAFSYLFYGWANPWFTLLMLGSTLVDYRCGLAMSSGGESTRKRALVVSICANLSLLGFFKYFNFAAENAAAFMRLIGLGSPAWEGVLQVTLPLGISFYTFQSMSYTIDVYRGDARPIRRFIDFACYVSMFPQLVAGPIVRFSDVSEQLRSRTHTLEKFARGAALFSVGMAKKVALANPCGKVADTVFEAGSLHFLDAWHGLLAYAFQIYFDFSGYSDMAIGLGLTLGFAFPKNFDSPYRSESITEFWRRWHISLSSWLRDYLYIPLGGNRKGPGRTYVNLALVMILGGLWHGASWNFVVWGSLHGGMLALERWRGKRAVYSGLPRWARVGLTFLLVCLGWAFFRAPDLGSAWTFLCSLAGLGSPRPEAALVSGVVYQPYYLICMVVSGLTIWLSPTALDWTERLTPLKAGAALAGLWLSLALLSAQTYNPFIYFIF